MHLREKNVVAFVTYNTDTFNWDSHFDTVQQLFPKKSEELFMVY